MDFKIENGVKTAYSIMELSHAQVEVIKAGVALLLAKSLERSEEYPHIFEQREQITDLVNVLNIL